MVQPGPGRTAWSVFLWSILPVVMTFAATIFGLFGTLTAKSAPGWLSWTVGPDAPSWLLLSLSAAAVLALLLIGKAIRDWIHSGSLRKARYDTVKELHNKLAPALNIMTELALVSFTAKALKASLLRSIANNCCGALVAMAGTGGVRATVYALNTTAVEAIATFGRSDVPRDFPLNSPQGQEIENYLSTGTPQPELYPDTRALAPAHYVNVPGRYQTFIRVPIYANGISFGMVTVDAPKKKSLRKHDVRVAQLVATVLGPAFAIAAN